MISILVGAALAAAQAEPAPAARVPSIKVGEVRSDRSCDLLAASWAWLLIECRKEFPKLRTALQSALLDSRKVRLSTSSGGRDVVPPDLTVSVRVTGLGGSTSRASAHDYCVASSTIEGRLDYRVRRARSGDVVYGGSVTKSVEVGSHAVAGSSRCGVGGDDPGAYEQLEREIALAAARAIVFRLAPLRVEAAGERGIALNYGSPFLRLGDAVDVRDRDGARLRFRVSRSDGAGAFATPDGPRGLVAVNAVASFVEPDDAMNNARRFDRVELP